jgi:hypothetical protein
MGYRIEATGEYFPTDHALRDFLRGSVDVSLPITLEFMEQHGIGAVFEGPQATGGTVYQYSQFGGIEQKEDGKWYTKYVLGPIFTDNEEATAAEQEAEYKARRDAEQANNIRQERNQRLSQCDWTQLDDSPGSQKLEWATYRQELRDLPTQSGFPWQVDWPTAPEA